MASRKNKNVKLEDAIRRGITQRMIDTGSYNESATIREILLDGLKSPRRPVIAKLGSRDELLKFSRAMLDWQQAYQSVRARLTLAMPDPNDKELCELVAKWRKLAHDLEAQARLLEKTAAALAETLLGLSPEDCTNLKLAKQTVIGFIATRQNKLSKADLSAAERADSEHVLKQYQAALKAFGIFGV
jgi:hypothetical protein